MNSLGIKTILGNEDEHIYFSMSVGAWFNGDKFVRPVMPYWEEEHFVGCIYKWRNKLFTETLDKLTPLLRAEKFVGWISCNAYIGEKPYVVSISTEMLPPVINAQIALHKDKWGKFLMSLANASTHKFNTSRNWCVCQGLLALPTIDSKPCMVEIGSGAKHIHPIGIIKKNGYIGLAHGYFGSLTYCAKTLDYAASHVEKLDEVDVVGTTLYRQTIDNEWLEIPSIAKKHGYFSR
jgi:hypothetical protein